MRYKQNKMCVVIVFNHVLPIKVCIHSKRNKRMAKEAQNMVTKSLDDKKGSSFAGITIIRKSNCEKKEVASISTDSASHVRGSTDRMTAHFRATVKSSIISQQQKGLPVARFDAESRKAYLEFPGGHRQYIE